VALQPAEAPQAPAAAASVGTVRRVGRFLRQNPRALVGLAIVAVFVLGALLAPVLLPGNPSAMLANPSSPPSWAYPLGTTDQGQNVLAELVGGARTSLMVGLIAGLLTTLLSVLVGMLSGFAGGIVDEALQLLTNVFLVIPALPLMIVLAAYIPFKGEGPIVLVITVTGWAWGARILRAQVLSMRRVDYVQSARLAGEGPLSVVLREILPNMLSLVASNFLFNVLFAILSEASLEFIGLGNMNVVSWGTMLYWANNDQALLSNDWWWLLAPGLAIAIVGGALAMLNYALDEVTNPRLRQAGGSK
jgi:peptide/nickel transport system permease protein